MNFPILPLLLPVPSKRRSGQKIEQVRFLVAHDTGNEGSTARQNGAYYARTAQEESASAHLFVDDTEILECIPALTGPPEKAWHVRYDQPQDNARFGDDANDCAIGVELCYGPNIHADPAYTRYVWVLAELCRRFHLNADQIAGHFQLDPGRRTDPVNALSKSGRSFEGLIQDVRLSLSHSTVLPAPLTLVATTALRLRTLPSTHAPILRVAAPQEVLVATVQIQGEAVNGNADWFSDGAAWWWGGGVKKAA
jgi:hypothetical protein